MPFARSETLPRRRHRAARMRGFTLVEVIISVGVLAVSTMGGISAFLILNRYAANLRNMSVARALCQERIEQALTLKFAPTNSTVPLAPNSDPSTSTATPTLPILGAIASYSTSAGTYNGTSNMQTSTESIPVYTQSDGTSAANGSITYTRTTTVSSGGLFYVTPTATTTTSLNLVQFQVTVSYVFHGQTYSTFMTTMRGPD